MKMKFQHEQEAEENESLDSKECRVFANTVGFPGQKISLVGYICNRIKMIKKLLYQYYQDYCIYPE